MARGALGDGSLAAYRITARALERQVVAEKVIREFASLEDCARPELFTVTDGGKPSFVLVLEDDEPSHPQGPKQPE